MRSHATIARDAHIALTVKVKARSYMQPYHHSSCAGITLPFHACRCLTQSLEEEPSLFCAQRTEVAPLLLGAAFATLVTCKRPQRQPFVHTRMVDMLPYMVASAGRAGGGAERGAGWLWANKQRRVLGTQAWTHLAIQAHTHRMTSRQSVVDTDIAQQHTCEATQPGSSMARCQAEARAVAAPALLAGGEPDRLRSGHTRRVMVHRMAGAGAASRGRRLVPRGRVAVALRAGSTPPQTSCGNRWRSMQAPPPSPPPAWQAQAEGRAVPKARCCSRRARGRNLAR